LKLFEKKVIRRSKRTTKVPIEELHNIRMKKSRKIELSGHVARM
jgi:hypothetical protein